MQNTVIAMRLPSRCKVGSQDGMLIYSLPSHAYLTNRSIIARHILTHEFFIVGIDTYGDEEQKFTDVRFEDSSVLRIMSR